jgi:hypothetical protein
MPGTVLDGEESLSLYRQKGELAIFDDEQAPVLIGLELKDCRIGR